MSGFACSSWQLTLPDPRFDGPRTHPKEALRGDRRTAAGRDEELPPGEPLPVGEGKHRGWAAAAAAGDLPPILGRIGGTNKKKGM